MKQSPAPARSNPKPKPQEPPADTTCRPLIRRPRTFATLLVLFVLWLAALLGLYFKTVYPMRYPPSDATTRPGASVLPSAPR